MKTYADHLSRGNVEAHQIGGGYLVRFSDNRLVFMQKEVFEGAYYETIPDAALRVRLAEFDKIIKDACADPLRGAGQMKPHRIGRFWLFAPRDEDQVAEIRKITAAMELVVVRAEATFWNDHIEYVAYSPLFEDLEYGMEAPYYTITTTASEDGSISVSVEKGRGW